MSSSGPAEELLADDGQDDDLVPAVDIPEPDPSADDIDSDVASLFVRLVLVFDVALFGISVGPLILYAEGNALLGGSLLVVGVLAGGYGFARYWQFRRDRTRQQ